MPMTKKSNPASPTLKFLAFCDVANVSREGKLSIIGIFDRIFAAKVPSSFIRLFIVAIFEGKPGSEAKIKLEIADPTGKPVLPPKDLAFRFGTNGKANLITDLVHLPLPVFGQYKISVSANGKKLGEENLWVSQTENRQRGTKHEKFEN